MATAPAPAQHSGFPADALDFYAELEANNTKAWWAANKARFQGSVRAPMESLMAALEPDFGPVTIFRPHRDVRFSPDKSPYKTHQGAYCTSPGGFAWYVAISADGLMVGAGGWRLASDQLATMRRSIMDDIAGPDLERRLHALTQAGYDVGGDALKTQPRGVPKNHPRLDLLRHTTLTVSRDIGTPPWLATPAVLDHVRAAWHELTPYLDWLDQYVGPTATPRDLHRDKQGRSR